MQAPEDQATSFPAGCGSRKRRRGMQVQNQTSSAIYFGPLVLGAGVGTTLTIDDTSATSLYLTNDVVADAVNNAAATNQILVTGAALPFPRPTGVPTVLHGDGNPE